MRVDHVWLMSLIVPHGDVQGQGRCRSSKTEPTASPLSNLSIFGIHQVQLNMVNIVRVFYDG